MLLHSLLGASSGRIVSRPGGRANPPGNRFRNAGIKKHSPEKFQTKKSESGPPRASDLRHRVTEQPRPGWVGRSTGGLRSLQLAGSLLSALTVPESTNPPCDP